MHPMQNPQGRLPPFSDWACQFTGALLTQLASKLQVSVLVCVTAALYALYALYALMLRGPAVLHG